MPSRICAGVWAGLLGVWLCGWPVAAQAAEPLRLHYFVRPPLYYVDVDGKVRGLAAEPVEKALQRSGLIYRWQETPSNRQLLVVQSGRGQDCAVGWYYTAERAKLGRFSRPVYRSRPIVALVSDRIQLASGGPVTQLLGRRDAILAVREQFSYGPELDRNIEQLAPRRVSSSQPIAEMMRLLQRGLADYLFASGEEADKLLVPGTRVVTFSDLRAGEARYLYCSFAVSEQTMAAINRALEETVPVAREKPPGS